MDYNEDFEIKKNKKTIQEYENYWKLILNEKRKEIKDIIELRMII